MRHFLLVMFLGVCIQFGWRYFAPESHTEERSPEALAQLAAAVQPDEVVMYTTTHCPYCAQARSWLNQHGFAFTECDAEKSQECSRQLQAYGGTGVPYLVVRGKHMKNGFEQDEFVSLLKN